MKRYVYAATTGDEAERYEDILADELISRGLIDAVGEYEVAQSSASTYRITVVLTAKKYHKKKFTITGYPSTMNKAIDKICYRINAWIQEGSEVLAADAYAIKVYLNDVLLGYFAGGGSGRGQHWAYIRSRNPAKISNPNRFDILKYSDGEFFIDESQLGYACLQLVEDTPELRKWLSTYTYHHYAYADKYTAKFTYEAIPYTEADLLKLNPAAFDSILIQPSHERRDN